MISPISYRTAIVGPNGAPLPAFITAWNAMVAEFTGYAPVVTGVPAGGTTGQVLHKASGTDYDTGWVTLATVAFTGAFADLVSHPTTLGGYGITDAQPLDGDLTSLAAASATGALYYRSAASTWGPVTIGTGVSFSGGTLSATGTGGTVTSVGLSSTDFTISGSPVTGSGSITANLATQAGITAASYGDASHSLTATVNSKGVLTGLSSQAIALPWGAITSGVPTTLAGYGITDALSNSPTSTQSGAFGQFSVYNSTSGFYDRLVNGDSTATAARKFTFNMLDANRVLTMGGDLTVNSGGATVGGTNTGDQTITLTGDVTGSGTGSLAATLAASGVTAATYGDASHSPSITFDAKGRATAASSVAIAIANTAVSGLGTASTVNTGTSGATVPLLSTANTWTLAQTFTVAPVFTDQSGTRTALGLGTLATQSGTFSGTSSGTNTGDETSATIKTKLGITTLSGSNTGDQTFSLTVPSIFTSGGSSTSALSFTLATEAANLVWAGPTTGTAAAPAFRSLVAADIPSLSTVYLPIASQAADSAKLGGTAASSYALLASPALTGTPTVPTATAGTNTTQAASTAFVTGAITTAQALDEKVANKDTSGGYPGLTTGTWTPAIAYAVPGTGTVAYTTQTGSYTRVGDLVFLDFMLVFTPTVGTASGSITITGLPYSIADITVTVGCIRSTNASWVWPTGKTQIALTAPSTTTLGITGAQSAAGSTAFGVTNLTSGSAHNIVGSIVYKA